MSVPPVRHHVRRSTRAMLRWTAAVVAGALALAACAPAASGILAPPTFRLVPEASGLTRLDLPGFSGAGADFVLAIDASNPNPVPMRLAALDGDVYLGGVRLAATTFDGGIDLPARGGARLTLEVRLGGDRLPDLLASLAGIVSGADVTYRVDGAIAVDVLGTVQRFPSVTLAEGTMSQDVVLAPPTVTLDAAASGVRGISVDRVTIDLALRVRNPNIVGVVLRAPDARLRVGDREVATVQLVPERLEARSETTLVQRVVVNPVQLGAAAVTQLQALAAGGAGSVEVALTGRWELDVPGLRSVRFDVVELVRGRLD